MAHHADTFPAFLGVEEIRFYIGAGHVVVDFVGQAAPGCIKAIEEAGLQLGIWVNAPPEELIVLVIAIAGRAAQRL